MAAPAPVYHRSTRRCQSVLAVGLVVLVGACSARGGDTPRFTGSLKQMAAFAGETPKAEHVRFSEAVAASDWDVLKGALATALVETEDGATVAWNNVETGSTGTVTPLVAARADGGSLCRAFAATVHGADGGNRYRGEACRVADGRWELLGVVADPGAL